ncbi:MAG: DUF3866 family protein [Actinobacteria bacterium]|nr:MAG: DUF3866 family protein [Actinomycetota bacterium]
MSVAFRELVADLVEREGRPRLEQQGDQVHQAFERVHGRGIILSAMSSGRSGGSGGSRSEREGASGSPPIRSGGSGGSRSERERASGSPPMHSGVRLRRGTVRAIRTERPGILELDVDVDDDLGDRGSSGVAVAFTDLVGSLAPGDRVLLNTTAVALGLGTGGFHLVVAAQDRAAIDLGHEGRVMKARYTPLQTAVRSVEETDREALEGSAGLGGAPVVCAPLHSMVAPIAAGARAAGGRTIAYVMSDGAALPGLLSNLVPSLRRRAFWTPSSRAARPSAASWRPSRSGRACSRPSSEWGRTW